MKINNKKVKKVINVQNKLILLSLSLFSCTNNKTLELTEKFNLSYIGGGEGGLYLNNMLKYKLVAADLFDKIQIIKF